MQSVPNLIAIYYQNIGPFQKSCSLLFDEGKYLIKAPIGSGKSFLFFDGPTYALYGSTGDKKTTGSKGRDILNKRSSQGEISLLFEVDSFYYLIKRKISRKKIQSSSASTFYKVHYLGENILQDIRKKIQKSDILLRDYNIIEEISHFNDLFSFEQVSFKNETDLQNNLNANLLLDKTVFLNTIFLLQDSKNVFECDPQERILILKNVFGLMGIDAGKEILSDEKRNLESKKKVLGDFEKENEKLTGQLKNLYKSYNDLKKCDYLKDTFGDSEDFFDEIEEFIDKIALDNFSISKLDKNIFLNIKKIIGEKNKDFQALLTAKKLLTEQYTSQKLGLQTNQEEQKRNTLLLEDLKNKIKEFDEHKIEKAKQERDQIFSSFSQIDKTVNYALFNKATQNNTFKREENEAPQQIQNFEEARLFLEKCAEKGKHTKQEITHLQDLQKQNQEKQQFWNEKQKGELENLKEKQKLLQQAVDEARQNYKNCSTNIDNEKLFSCDKIQGNCPYITLINKKHFEEREKEQQKFLEILEQKEKELKEFNFTEKFQKKEEEKSDYDFEKKHQELSEKIKNSEKLCEDLRDFLLQAQYSEMKQKNEERSNMFKEFQIKDKIFNQLFEEKEKIQKYQQEIIAGETKLENLKKQEEELQQQFQKTQEQLQKQEEELQKISSQSLEKNNLEIENFLKSYENIEGLLADFFEKKQTIKQVEERLEKIKNLYNILNSELVVYSFQNFLPVLTEHINILLSSIVSFSLNMKPEPKTNGDLELKILFNDEKGERDVSSLSGGQKTVLKLVRMLAISSYLKTPLLFLDETINNLDGEAVSRVATLINNFVKSNTIKFYTITHNSEIQAMNIWDQTIHF